MVALCLLKPSLDWQLAFFPFDLDSSIAPKREVKRTFILFFGSIDALLLAVFSPF